MLICPIAFATPEYDESIALRYEVLRKPLGLSFSPEQLAKEWADTHLAAFHNSGKMVGILVLSPLDDEIVKMRQVAVTAEMQGRGVGAALVAQAENTAQAAQFKKMVLNARETAVPFYLRLGYQIVGERFEEVSIPHFKMEKTW